jgi:carboxypeptidase C (cathepsin A)
LVHGLLRNGHAVFRSEYTLGHISIDPSLLKNFSTSYYEAGHMMYIDEKSLTKLHADVASSWTTLNEHRERG